jgi:hypothetical protein
MRTAAKATDSKVDPTQHEDALCVGRPTTAETTHVHFQFLNQYFSAPLQHGPAVITKMAYSLAEQSSFPDLEGWEDTAEKKRQAAGAACALREYLQRAEEEAASGKEREETKRRVRAAQQKVAESSQTLEKLSKRLDQLARDLGTQEAGYQFQD